MNKKIRIGVLGAGAWGTAIALLLSKKNNVLLWANEKKVVQEINLKNKNDIFLESLIDFDAIREAVGLPVAISFAKLGPDRIEIGFLGK